MSELRKIAIGLLSMSHPEIQRLRTSDSEVGPLMAAPRALKATGSKLTFAATVLRGVKFAFAALLAGSRAIPLGDNGRVTRELGEYGAHLKGC